MFSIYYSYLSVGIQPSPILLSGGEGLPVYLDAGKPLKPPSFSQKEKMSLGYSGGRRDPIRPLPSRDISRPPAVRLRYCDATIP
jgi:hypothetical protein